VSFLLELYGFGVEDKGLKMNGIHTSKPLVRPVASNVFIRRVHSMIIPHSILHALKNSDISCSSDDYASDDNR
jgi:hypothetical protein